MNQIVDSAQTALVWEELWGEGAASAEWSHSGIAVLADGTVVFAHPAGGKLVLLDPVAGTSVEEPTGLLEMHSIIRDPFNADHVWLADPGQKPRPTGYFDGNFEVVPGRVVRWHVGHGASLELLQPENAAYEADSWHPTSVVAAGDGNIWVADGYGSSLVHVYSADGTWLKTLTGAETGLDFKCPHGLAVDGRSGSQQIVVADRGNKRLVFLSLDGDFDRAITDPLMDSPSSLAIRGDDLLVTELNGGLLSVGGADLFTSLVDKPAGPRPEGWPNGVAAAGGACRPDFVEGQLRAPHGLTVDSEGAIYLTEWLIGGRQLKLTLKD